MAARKRSAIGKIPMPDSWREKIRTTEIMRRMEKGAMGEVDLSPEQISAAKLVLGKVLPDLARQELTGKDGKDLYDQMTDEELEARIAEYDRKRGMVPKDSR